MAGSQFVTVVNRRIELSLRKDDWSTGACLCRPLGLGKPRQFRMFVGRESRDLQCHSLNLFAGNIEIETGQVNSVKVIPHLFGCFRREAIEGDRNLKFVILAEITRLEGACEANLSFITLRF